MTPTTFDRGAGTMAMLAAALCTALCACAVGPAVTVPGALDPGASARETAMLAAAGVQVYECGAGGWTFVEPQATLFDRDGRVVGTHGAGPSWQAHDGSRIDGRVLARADAPAPGDLPWLLLRTQPRADGGLLAGVTHVQRLHTRGGVAPAEPCTAARQGQRRLVPYRADYRLFVAA